MAIRTIRQSSMAAVSARCLRAGQVCSNRKLLLVERAAIGRAAAVEERIHRPRLVRRQQGTRLEQGSICADDVTDHGTIKSEIHCFLQPKPASGGGGSARFWLRWRLTALRWQTRLHTAMFRAARSRASSLTSTSASRPLIITTRSDSAPALGGDRSRWVTLC